MAENVLYKLQKIADDPDFEGFGFCGAQSFRGKGLLDYDFGPDDVPTKGRAWTVTRMAPTWVPVRVRGKVKPHNDYPCVNLGIPAFSRRAVDVLRDFLEPNGELLPLVSSRGEYYAYNITTVVDILDHDRSDIVWFNDKHVTAVRIRRFECIPEKLAGLSIFRLVDLSAWAFVAQVFVDRVREHGLRGFDFIRLWPLPESESGQQ